MDKVTNEMLMAFIDGELDPGTREKIRKALQSDPELRAKAAIFEATRRPVANVFDPILSQPLSRPPKVVRTGVGKEGLEADEPRRHRSRRRGFVSWVSGLFEWSPTLPLAVAACAVFLGGLAIGVLMKGGLVSDEAPGAALVVLHDDGFVAGESLSGALETVRSGTATATQDAKGGEIAIKPILTFRDHKDRFCREYEIVYPAANRLAGLACRRGDEDWSVLVHTPLAPSAAKGNETSLANGGGIEVIDAVVERIMKGDALGSSEEASLMSKGWRVRD